MKKIFIFFLFITVISTFLFLLITNKTEDEKPKVVVVLKETDSQYYKIIEAGVEKGFKDFGIDGKVIAPSSSNSEQDEPKNILKTVLLKKPDVVVIAPIETPQYMSILEKFIDNEIPVLLLDTNVPLKNKTSYIGTNNYELGRKAGALLASELQPGNEVALIASNLTSPVSGDRVRGAKSNLEEAGIKIVAEKVNLSNEPLPVKKAIRDVLQNHPNLKGVFATTDIMALSALEELEKLGYNIPVIGTDGTPKMAELVEKGKLPGTVAQNPYNMGYLSVQTAMNVAMGKNVDTIVDSGVDILIKGNGNERLTFYEKHIFK
ncbi:MAG: sugar ABC transporter substrate-binding protein [Bacillota bacterium]